MTKAVILAAGYSKRTNSAIPKQLTNIGGRPLIAYTLDVFERCKQLDSIILVVNRSYVHRCQTLIRAYNKVEQLCLGGKTRQQSVFNALQQVRDCDYIIIHDGVRPFVSGTDILQLIKAVKGFSAVSFAVKAKDTTVQAEEGFISGIIQRDLLWQIQTPQAFRFDLILKAHQRAKVKKISHCTDDTQLVLKMGHKIKILPGNCANFKITTAFDLDLAKLVLKKRCLR